MAVDQPIPDKFNGKSTRYQVFDGFREAGTMGKILYVAGVLGSFGLIPIAMEVSSSMDANSNATKAKEYYAAHPDELPGAAPKTPSRQQTVEMNPDAPQDGRFAAAQSPDRQTAIIR